MKLKDTLTQDNIVVGYLYFYVHLMTEIICFFALSRVIGDSIVLWLTPLIYDALAFVPQSLFGYISDKHQKLPLGTIGTIVMIIGLIMFSVTNVKYLPMTIIALGNSCTHVAGAEATLRVSKGRMSHAAIFVSGGSFGVIIGKILGKTSLSYMIICLLSLTMIPFSLLADTYKDEIKEKRPCKNFNYHNKKIHPMLIIIFATLVVMTRGYMGYGIPTTWNKTIVESVVLYFTMGLGKALGGIFIDTYGIRKTALLSTVIALPFLIIGDNLMLVSVIGVMCFSMTMAVTLALLVSVLKDTPGLAFGHTTIGLFLGTVPIFFFRITSFYINAIMLTVLTIICVLMLNLITKKEDKV